MDIEQRVDNLFEKLNDLKAIVPGTDERWRAYLRACLRKKLAEPVFMPSDRLFALPSDEHAWTRDELLEDIEEAAFRLILSSPDMAKHPQIEVVRRLARQYMARVLSDEEALRREDTYPIMELGVVGERLGYWDGLPPHPR